LLIIGLNSGFISTGCGFGSGFWGSLYGYIFARSGLLSVETRYGLLSLSFGLFVFCGSYVGCKWRTSWRRFDFDATFGSAV